MSMQKMNLAAPRWGVDRSVIVYSERELLLQTRAWVLEKAGFRVYLASDLATVKTLIPQHDPALIILCHSLQAAQCEAALELANSWQPPVKTLVLTAGPSECSEATEGSVLDAREGPDDLIVAVRLLVEEDSHTEHLGDLGER